MKRWKAAFCVFVCMVTVTGITFATDSSKTTQKQEVQGNRKVTAPGILGIQGGSVVAQDTYEKEHGTAVDETPDESVGNSEYFPEVPERDNTPEELEKPIDGTQYLSMYEGQYVEFVGFNSQELSESFHSFIVANLSSNECNIVFQIKKGSKILCKTEAVAPGVSEAISLYDLLDSGSHTISVISQAYAFDGTQLNAISQDIVVTVAKKKGETEDTATTYENQSQGAIYNATVVYRADNTKFSVAVPAMISVTKGTVGTKFNVGFRVQNLKDGTLLGVSTDDGLNSSDAYVLQHDGVNSAAGTVTYAITSGLADNAMVLGYAFEENDSLQHWVGPAYCTIGSGKQASMDYYGTLTFYLTQGGV